MRAYFRILFVMGFVSTALFAQTQRPAQADQAKIVAVAQKAALAAVNFREGDAPSLNHARADFTTEGWKDYMKRMQGFLDTKGAPTFSSSFVPTENATVLGEENGIVHFRVPDTLTQSNNLGKTTYRSAIEVYAIRDLLVNGGKPIKIQHLEQITCAGASAACQ
jgi:hypothetical protein